MTDVPIAIVDENDLVVGAETRSVARKRGLRHRIVRVFLINSNGQILLQQRSLELTDSPGKWDQSVGGHVDEGEGYDQAAIREAYEELGIQITELRNLGKIYIERSSPDGYIRRFQTVFTTRYDGELHPNMEEVAQVRWFSIREITDWHTARPDDFTRNFIKAFALLNPDS
jgi:isopentenyl-diphosphate delta-isomerase type 1